MHSCPECGQACYCLGDIDDIEMSEEVNCVHCDGSAEDEDYEDSQELLRCSCGAKVALGESHDPECPNA